LRFRAKFCTVLRSRISRVWFNKENKSQDLKVKTVKRLLIIFFWSSTFFKKRHIRKTITAVKSKNKINLHVLVALH